MQYDGGTWIGRQAGPASDPMFWVWRPTTGPHVEFWVFYKYNQAGGFKPPGIGVSSVDWHISRSNGGNYKDGCEFMSWVADEFNHPESDLEVREHKISILDCPG